MTDLYFNAFFLAKLKGCFGLEEVVLAGDRGMLTQVKIDALKEIGNIDWVCNLGSTSIKRPLRISKRVFALEFGFFVRLTVQRQTTGVSKAKVRWG